MTDPLKGSRIYTISLQRSNRCSDHFQYICLMETVLYVLEILGYPRIIPRKLLQRFHGFRVTIYDDSPKRFEDPFSWIVPPFPIHMFIRNSIVCIGNIRVPKYHTKKTTAKIPWILYNYLL